MSETACGGKGASYAGPGQGVDTLTVIHASSTDKTIFFILICWKDSFSFV